MDFETYKKYIIIYSRVFEALADINEKSIALPKDVKEAIIQTLHAWMDESPNSSNYDGISQVMPLSADMLSALKVDEVNLLATQEELVEQAELVKQEIIKLGRSLKELRRAYPQLFIPKVTNSADMLTDYIKDPSGKTVTPFKFWRDCVEVYLLKFLKGKSNADIATKHDFKSSKSGTPRARLSVVATMLTETENLIKTVKSNLFPPTTLSGSRQPTMLN
jgi:hypothetical protein